ncbi:NAD-dependent epimerase/dehydratase family protein [Aurantimonas sp. VKM B-3413]|uniref:NAD-dependent epimerase/dehydratase family protein n=1 Tax=Aurantimonas sp. VKM B-3413 TaxID=2779401 RepID=UPI001E5EA611|nr:NAD-dependent epimerase/dehydratase family protein [Aurantimonas sp. VKM B-3413]MCB8839305.1 NAD-dependent epimerase/dehydratase family protein [Aurantimonas sp. VKM B-3413]
MRVLLTGGSGFVGRHLHAELTSSGADVLVLARGGAPGPGRIAGPVDLAELTPRDLPEGLDAIVHLAAANPERGTEEAGDIAFLRRANRDGTAALAAAAAARQVRRLVFLSTANVHAPAADPISETAPIAPQNLYAASKAEAEDALWRALEGSDTSACILRPGPVFGPGGRGTLGLLIRLASTPAPLPFAAFTAPRSVLFVDHLVEAIRLALQSEAAAGETALVADPDPLSPAEIIAAVRRGLGRSRRLFAAPPGLLTQLAGLAGRGEALAQLRRPFVLDTGRLQGLLAFRPASTARNALELPHPETEPKPR